MYVREIECYVRHIKMYNDLLRSAQSHEKFHFMQLEGGKAETNTLTASICIRKRDTSALSNFITEIFHRMPIEDSCNTRGLQRNVKSWSRGA